MDKSQSIFSQTHNCVRRDTLYKDDIIAFSELESLTFLSGR